MDKVHGSSDRGTWETPPTMVADLATVFRWDLDVCASGPNVCPRFYSKADEGLAQIWRGLCWMNPPYGKKRGIDRWMRKARADGSKLGTAVVCLPPARTSTRWWQDNVLHASLCVLIRGRLTFGSDEYWAWVWEQPEINGKPNKLYQKHGRRQSAPFPSALVVFGRLPTWDHYAKLLSYGMAVWPQVNAGMTRPEPLPQYPAFELGSQKEREPVHA